MAARLRKTHQEDVRLKIKCTQLVNFIQNHALDDKPASPTRIDAAKFLLNKVISNPPTDSNVNLNGKMEISSIARRIIDPDE